MQWKRYTMCLLAAALLAAGGAANAQQAGPSITPELEGEAQSVNVETRTVTLNGARFEIHPGAEIYMLLEDGTYTFGTVADIHRGDVVSYNISPDSRTRDTINLLVISRESE